MIDKWGNDEADTLAVDGGETHAAPEHLVATFNRRRKVSKATHGMMVRIFEARKQAESVLGRASPDNI